MSFKGILLGLFVVGTIAILAEQGLSKLVQLKGREDRVQQENQNLARENQGLIRRIQLYQKRDVQERLIRSELGYVRPDEHVYEFKE